MPSVSQTRLSLNQTSKMDIAGLDVGLTLVDLTSGVCRTGPNGDLVTHTYIDRLSRSEALGAPLNFAAIAIDAPILPVGQLHYRGRACEKVFVWGPFQNRCKCGESHIPGTGQALRRAGADTAHAFAASVCSDELARSFPRIFGTYNIVEAFPNAFLGVSLADSAFSAGVPRTEKFDWLYSRWLEHEGDVKLRNLLYWDREGFWRAVTDNRHHDERAAIVCTLTALCVLRGEYVAVGDRECGYFFLPPWRTWAPWARDAVDKNRRDRRLPSPVELWVNGTKYGPERALPTIDCAG
jgi:hypothetical protein